MKDAGIEYPKPTHWNEMGGSKKDLWEERQLRSTKRRERMTTSSDAAEIPTKPELTPYDTEEVLEPKLWSGEGDDFDRFGRVDIDDDAGETVFTMQVKRDGDGYRLKIDGRHDVELVVSATREPSAAISDCGNPAADLPPIHLSPNTHARRTTFKGVITPSISFYRFGAVRGHNVHVPPIFIG